MGDHKEEDIDSKILNDLIKEFLNIVFQTSLESGKQKKTCILKTQNVKRGHEGNVSFE